MNFIKEILCRTPQSPIYHYTSQAGLLGIIRNRCIWVTNIHYLNDSEEFSLAIGIARSEIKSKRHTCPDVREMLDSTEVMLTGLKRMNMFVCSFSENGDLLSQWRGYCPRGNGFSVGFDYQGLAPLLEQQEFFLAPCIYDTEAQREIVREVVEKMIEGYRAEVSQMTGCDDFALASISRFFKELYSMAPILKHSTFAEEHEWRMISGSLPSDHPRIAYREGVSMLTPYFNFSLENPVGTLPISDIIVGPTPHKDLSLNSVAMFMRARAKYEWRLSYSKIPYRGW